ncbi:hypothetical protein KBA41_12695 [Candidatus Ozemobacteraceae bacterium]|nr:hypothetical protein [Candidatus Ozemobacteraceae bacterium]
MFRPELIGVGSAFTTREYYQSNLLVIAEAGKKLLIDCASQAQFARKVQEFIIQKAVPENKKIIIA